MKRFLFLTATTMIIGCSTASSQSDTSPAPAHEQSSPADEESDSVHHHHGGDSHDHHHSHPDVQHRFEDAERWAKVFDNPERDTWQRPDEVVAVMQIEPGMTVADVGAGTGYFLGPLAEAVGPDGRVLGLDIEESLIEHMRERIAKSGWENVEARVVASDDPQLDDASVDRVLIVNTWHHISDRIPYASRLAKGLRPGGRLYIVDFTIESERGPSKDHKLTPESVMEELTAAGLTAELAEETLPDQYIVVGTVAP